MEPVLQFLGNFWWLVFPLMGVAGGAARAWERGVRGRHKRRLEVLHAKAELKAASRTGSVPAASLPALDAELATDAAATAPEESPLQRLMTSHDDVTHRWLEYELDVAKLISYPAMSDGRQPLTAAFLRAKKVADGLRPASAKAKVTREQLAEYRAAVTDYEVAFDVAERDARRIKDSGFTDLERKRLDTAKQLLTVAIDQAATPAERQLAYKRVREELDGLLSLSDDAIDVLEKKVALELEAGSTGRDAGSSADLDTAAARPPRPPGASADDGPAAVPAAPEAVRVPRTPSTAPGHVIHPKRRP